jgi:hypothetical protein
VQVKGKHQQCDSAPEHQAITPPPKVGKIEPSYLGRSEGSFGSRRDHTLWPRRSQELLTMPKIRTSKALPRTRHRPVLTVRRMIEHAHKTVDLNHWSWAARNEVSLQLRTFDSSHKAVILYSYTQPTFCRINSWFAQSSLRNHRNYAVVQDRTPAECNFIQLEFLTNP